MLLLREEERPINKELFDILKKWRRDKAHIENIKPYIIFSDSTLIEIVNKRPKTKEELLELRGVGEKKVDKYSTELFNILNIYSN